MAAPTAEEFAALKVQLEVIQGVFRNCTSQHGAKPPNYEGSQEPHAIEGWVQTMDDYFEMNPRDCNTPRLAVLTAASYQVGSSRKNGSSATMSVGCDNRDNNSDPGECSTM